MFVSSLKRLKIWEFTITPMTDFKKEDWLVNLPLYAIEQIAKEAEEKENGIY